MTASAQCVFALDHKHIFTVKNYEFQMTSCKAKNSLSASFPYLASKECKKGISLELFCVLVCQNRSSNAA